MENNQPQNVQAEELEQKDKNIVDLDDEMRLNIHQLQNQDLKTFLPILKSVIANTLSKKSKLIFIKNTDQPQKFFMMMEGEIGSGKSTTNTTLMYLYCTKNKLDYKDKVFKYGRQIARVTTSVEVKEAGDIILADSPGTNDFQSSLSDYEIQKMKHECMSKLFRDSTQGVSCINQCIMIDDGGRLKQTSIDSIARTFHALTYSYPDFDERKDKGPRINIIFTKFSKFFKEEDDAMIPGLESVSKYSNMDLFKELRDKFRKELSKRIFDDLEGKQPLDQIEIKVLSILQKSNFYAFKIFPGNEDNMVQERSELERLIKEAQAHGRYFIQNYDEERHVMNLPSSFAQHDTSQLNKKLTTFFDTLDLLNQQEQKYFKDTLLLDKSCEPLINIVDELKELIKSLTTCYDSDPWVFMRNPQRFGAFVDEMIRHVPGVLKQEMKNDLILEILKSKNNQIEKLESEKNQLRRDKIHDKETLTNNYDKRLQDNDNNHEKRYTDMVERKDKKLSQEQKTHTDDRAAIEKRYNTQIQNLRNEHSQEVENIHKRYSNKDAVCAQKLSDKENDCQNRLDAQLQRHKDQLELEQQRYAAKIKENHETVQQTFAVQVKGLEKQIQTAYELKDKEIFYLKQAQEHKLNCIEEQKKGIKLQANIDVDKLESQVRGLNLKISDMEEKEDK